MSTSKEIVLENVGPVQSLSIPVYPGVIVLRGQNDCGKSETLKAVSRLAGGNDSVSCRDDAAAGYVAGLGVTVSVRKSARCSGKLEALSIEGKLNIADLVSPPIKDPVAADRHRIKALLQLTGAKADWALFAHLYGVRQHISHEAQICGDLVEMAAKIKRDLETVSRQETSGAEKEEAKAFACQQATQDVDKNIETDAKLLQANLEDALYAHGDIVSRARSAKDAKDRAEIARANIEKMALRDRLGVAELEQRLSNCQGELDAANRAVIAAEEALRAARAKVETCNITSNAAKEALESGRREEELLAGWRDSVAQAEGIESPTPEDIAEAEAAVTSAHEAIDRAAVVRAAVEKAKEANSLRDSAKLHHAEAGRLRDAAKGTDDVLSDAVASDAIFIRAGRMITKHPERGEVFFGERSDGTRWKLAIDEAIKRIRQLGAEKTAIIPIPQAAWSELDPANKAAIHAYAVEQGVTIVTAEATDGELRAEAFRSQFCDDLLADQLSRGPM